MDVSHHFTQGARDRRQDTEDRAEAEPRKLRAAPPSALRDRKLCGKKVSTVHRHCLHRWAEVGGGLRQWSHSWAGSKSLPGRSHRLFLLGLLETGLATSTVQPPPPALRSSCLRDSSQRPCSQIFLQSAGLRLMPSEGQRGQYSHLPCFLLPAPPELPS